MTYIPKITDLTDEIIKTLHEEEFFLDFDIQDVSYATKRFSEEITKKFILHGLDDETSLFTENEFDKLLKEIAAESLLRSLQNKGFINSYADDNVEEVFFLTKEGKEELNKMKDEENNDILNVFKTNEKLN